MKHNKKTNSPIRKRRNRAGRSLAFVLSLLCVFSFCGSMAFAGESETILVDPEIILEESAEDQVESEILLEEPAEEQVDPEIILEEPDVAPDDGEIVLEAAPTAAYNREEALAAADAVQGDHLILLEQKEDDTFRPYLDNGADPREYLFEGSESFGRAVQRGLNWINENGDGALYRIKIPDGTYTLEDDFSFNIYSNTIFDCRSENDTETEKAVKIFSGTTALIIRAGRRDDAQTGVIANPGGYDDYQNIMLLGGSWSGQPGAYGGNIRFCHASNIYLLDMLIRDNYGSGPDEPLTRGHHVEIGGASGVLVSNCEITGSHGVSGETIQVEVVHRQYDNCTGYAPYDDLPTCNMTVENCYFHDITRGVGSHHIIFGQTFNNIRIINNTFENLSDRAVLAAYFKNSVIQNNVITNAYAGIQSYSVFRRHTYYKNGVNSGSVETLNSGLTIADNIISLNANSNGGDTSDTDLYKFGIRVDGGEITDKTAEYTEYITQGYTYDDKVKVTKTLPVGDYYQTGVEIRNNTISVYDAAHQSGGIINAGISMDHLKNSVVADNTIDLANCEVDAGAGILMKGCIGLTIEQNNVANLDSSGTGIKARLSSKNISVLDNIITNAAVSGVEFHECSGGEICGNQITGTLNGVYVRDSSNGQSVNENVIRDCEQNGISFSNATVNNCDGNKITNTVSNGISLRSSTVENIRNNTIIKAGTDQASAAIRLASNSKSSLISGNKIDGKKKSMYGVRVVESTVGTIDKNIMENLMATGYGIMVQSSASVTAVTANKLAGSGRDILKVSADATVKTAKSNVFGTTILSINKTTLELAAESAYALSVSVLPASEADTVTWKSSNAKIASVDQNGKVTAKQYGTATITATAADGTKVTCKVNVLFKDATRENVNSAKFTAIYWLAGKKITKNSVNFGTAGSMTRGQFVRFLFRYSGEEGKYKVNGKSPFKDVDKNYTHYEAIMWAVSKGLINGYSGNVFKPEDKLTRNHVATILWKFAGSPKAKSANKPFTDVPKSTAIAWGKEKGIYTGTGKFYPSSPCTRGDFAVFLYRYDKYAKK